MESDPEFPAGPRIDLWPRDCFREAFSYGLLSDEEAWVQMLQDRNLSVHTYNEELANQLYARLPRYVPALRNLVEKLQIGQ